MDPFFLGHLAVWHQRPSQKGSTAARVLIVHGISEHSGRHLNTVNALLEAGYEIVRFDLRGAGRSGGSRQWVERFEDYVTDLTRVANWIHRELPRLPLFVLGHSLGGAISIYYTALYGQELTGLIVSAPAYQIGNGISPFKVALGKLVHRLAPTLRIKDTSTHETLSRDPAVVAAYEQDPLSTHYNTTQQGVEILRAIETLPARCAQIKTPVMISHGTADRIIRLEGSFELLRHFGGGDREMMILPGGYHEPQNDLGKEEYFSGLIRWIKRHAPIDASPKTRPPS